MTDKFAWDDGEFEIVDPEERTDGFNPDQPRGPDGKWAPDGGGGGAHVKENLGTVGKLREAAYSPPKWNSEGGAANSQARRAEEKLKEGLKKANAMAPKYNNGEQAAKALAGKNAGEEAYRQQLAEHFGEANSGMRPWEIRERGENIQENEQKLSAQGHESHEPGPNTLHGQHNLPDPAFGAMDFEGKAPKELEDRIHEALKNNAAKGAEGEDPAKVVADVHERIAKEKADEIARQAAWREREAKLAAVRGEGFKSLRAADEKVAYAEQARLAARDKERELRDKVDELDDEQRRLRLEGKPVDGEAVAKLAAEYDRAQEAHMVALDARDAARAERKALEPKSPERTSSAKNLSDLAGTSVVETHSLGGGMNGSEVAILDDRSKAVYKPVSGERDQLRKNIDGGTYYLREAASSAVAEQLGVADLVPATVIHDGPEGLGSLQAFVPDSKTLSNFYDGVMFDKDAAERMRVFDWITGNSDRHDSNVMVVTKDHDHEDHTLPILIDNGLSFPKGMPERVITPTDYVPHDRMSDKTVSLINGIDHVKLASTLAASGIEREAIRYTLARANMLKDDPQMMHSRGYDWDEVPEPVHDDLERADKVLADPAVTAAFEKGEPIYRAAMARKE